MRTRSLYNLPNTRSFYGVLEKNGIKSGKPLSRQPLAWIFGVFAAAILTGSAVIVLTYFQSIDAVLAEIPPTLEALENANSPETCIIYPKDCNVTAPEVPIECDGNADCPGSKPFCTCEAFTCPRRICLAQDCSLAEFDTPSAPDTTGDFVGCLYLRSDGFCDRVDFGGSILCPNSTTTVCSNGACVPL